MNKDDKIENISNKNSSTEVEGLKGAELKKNRFSRFKNLKYIAITSVALIALIAVPLLYYSTSKDSKNTEVNEVLPCTDENISNAIQDTSKALDPTMSENINALPEITDRIVTYDNYENDMYCLNILTTKYAIFGGYDDAKKYLDMLEAKLAQNNIEELPQKNYFWNTEELRASVESLKAKAELFEKNSSFQRVRQLPDGTILPEDSQE